MPRRAERAGPAMGEAHGTDRPPRGLRTARLRPDVSLQSTGAPGACRPALALGVRRAPVAVQSSSVALTLGDATHFLPSLRQWVATSIASSTAGVGPGGRASPVTHPVEWPCRLEAPASWSSETGARDRHAVDNCAASPKDRHEVTRANLGILFR